MKNWILMIGLTVLFSCGQKTEETSDTTQTILPVTEQQARSILTEYLHVKDALVASDAAMATTHLKGLTGMLGEGESDFHQAVSKSADSFLQAEDVEGQRVAFEDLTKAMDVLRSAWDGDLYKQYCPMAFDDKGAYWYSAEKEILNPYFGDAMLRCGRIVED